ncbi:MAG: hypothetical protein VB125_04080 [Burkholderia sp.]
MGSRDRFPGNRSIGSCRGAQPHDGTRSSAVRPYRLRSKTWESLRLRSIYATTLFSSQHNIPLGRCCTSDLRPPHI